MAECIHGFDDGLCDTCSPKAAPVRPVASRVTSRSTGSAARREPRASASPRVKIPAPALLDQRVYHVTHVSNLAAILAEGALLAPALASPTVDVSSALTRELRETAEVTGGGSVSEYVPFFLAPDADAWVDLREGAEQPRWSTAARSAVPTDFVFLVSTVRTLGEISLADGDAAGTYTRFATGDSVLGMLGRLHGSPTLAGAEALVRESVPLDAVQLVGVASDPVRDRVRGLLQDAGRSTKVIVYPPWFVGDLG